LKGRRTVNELHRELGRVMWEHVGMARSEERPWQGPEAHSPAACGILEDVRVPGSGAELNQELEKAGRVADFLEFGELMARDALLRRESCGGHFRVEYQMADGEARRDDENFCYVAAWQYKGVDQEPGLHKESLGIRTRAAFHKEL